MPAYDLTIAALWTAPSRGGKGSNITLIVGIVVPVIVLIIAIAVVVVIVSVFHRKKSVGTELSKRRRPEFNEPLINRESASAAADRYQRRDRYQRVVASSKDEVEDNVPKKNDQSILTYLYPKDYTRLTMKEALAEAGEEDF